MQIFELATLLVPNFYALEKLGEIHKKSITERRFA